MKIKNNWNKIWKTRIENKNKKRNLKIGREEKQRGGRHAIKVDDLKCHLYILNQFPLFTSNVGQHASSAKKDMYWWTHEQWFDACLKEWKRN